MDARVTRLPSSAWVTQQLREATAWGEGPRFLIRDNDDTFGARLDEVAEGTGIESPHTPIRAPNANACCERFLRSVRAECIDHVLILDEDHLASILQRYCSYLHDARPYQGIAQKIPHLPPEPPAVAATVANDVDIYPQIEADFQFAVDNLPEVQTAQAWRPNLWAARAFLAKLA